MFKTYLLVLIHVIISMKLWELTAVEIRTPGLLSVIKLI